MTKHSENLKTRTAAAGKSPHEQRREIEDGRRAIREQLEPIEDPSVRLKVLDRICRRAEDQGDMVMVLCALERAAVEASLLEPTLMDSRRWLH